MSATQMFNNMIEEVTTKNSPSKIPSNLYTHIVGGVKGDKDSDGEHSKHSKTGHSKHTCNFTRSGDAGHASVCY